MMPNMAGSTETGGGPKKLYKIGEIMKYTGLSRQTIHNYTMMGLIQEAERTDSGHRLYGQDVFDRLQKIEMLKRHRTLREVIEILSKEK
jgi:DNA-binding transcriptional MerR regulator